MHNIEDAFWEPGLLQQLGDPHRRQRCQLRRLQHEGVAGNDRHRDHPHRHHVREVEGRDTGNDANRESGQLFIDAFGDLVEVLAHHQRGSATGEVDHLDCALDFAPRLIQRLAILLGHQRGELVDVLIEEGLEAEQHLGPLRHWGFAPSGKSLLGGGNRLVDLVAG